MELRTGKRVGWGGGDIGLGEREKWSGLEGWRGRHVMLMVGKSLGDESEIVATKMGRSLAFVYGIHS